MALLADQFSSARRLAWLLDNAIVLPGGYRIGVDGIIGLIPVVGDVIAAALSAYIIYAAGRMRAPLDLLVRMGANVLLEMLIGSVPLFGDIFDIAFKANMRNVALMDAHLAATHRKQSDVHN